MAVSCAQSARCRTHHACKPHARPPLRHVRAELHLEGGVPCGGIPLRTQVVLPRAPACGEQGRGVGHAGVERTYGGWWAWSRACASLVGRAGFNVRQGWASRD